MRGLAAPALVAFAAAAAPGAAEAQAPPRNPDPAASLIGSEWLSEEGCVRLALEACADGGLCATVAAVDPSAAERFAELGGRVGTTRLLDAARPIPEADVRRCGGFYAAYDYAGRRWDWQTGFSSRSFLSVERDDAGAATALRFRSCQMEREGGCAEDGALNWATRQIAHLFFGDRVACAGRAPLPQPTALCSPETRWTRLR